MVGVSIYVGDTEPSIVFVDFTGDAVVGTPDLVFVSIALWLMIFRWCFLGLFVLRGVRCDWYLMIRFWSRRSTAVILSFQLKFIRNDLLGLTDTAKKVWLGCSFSSDNDWLISDCLFLIIILVLIVPLPSLPTPKQMTEDVFSKLYNRLFSSFSFRNLRDNENRNPVNM